jgi:hypothetical protein
MFSHFFGRPLRLFWLSILFIGTMATPGWAESLKTKNHRVIITRNCPEGSVTCNNVSYYGLNFRTGTSIRLKGKTLHRLCADGVTPCQFLGYEFFNGNTRYVVGTDGSLRVTQGKRLILQEIGTWVPDNR